MTRRRVQSGPRHLLPTERINTRRQLELLDVVTRLGGPSMGPVPVVQASAQLGVSEATIRSAQGFLRQNGLLVPSRGTLAAAAEGLALCELRVTDSARARLYLRDL